MTYETLYWPLVRFAQSSFGQSAGLGRCVFVETGGANYTSRFYRTSIVP
jgi:hypothetical protein